MKKLKKIVTSKREEASVLQRKWKIDAQTKKRERIIKVSYWKAFIIWLSVYFPCLNGIITFFPQNNWHWFFDGHLGCTLNRYILVWNASLNFVIENIHSQLDWIFLFDQINSFQKKSSVVWVNFESTCITSQSFDYIFFKLSSAWNQTVI